MHVRDIKTEIFMKLNLNVFLILLTMIISFGCGANKTKSTASSSQNELMAKNGVQVVSASSNFAGDWGGYIEEDFVSLQISSNGSVQFKGNGTTFQEKLVKNSQNQYFITDTENKQLLPINSSGTSLTLFAQDGFEYYFSRN